MRAFGPLLLRLVLGDLRPVQRGPGARRRFERQTARARAQRQQRLQDQGRVVVVDALLVAFAIARRGEVANRAAQHLGLGKLLMQQVQAQSFAIAGRGFDHQSGQVLAAV